MSQPIELEIAVPVNRLGIDIEAPTAAVQPDNAQVVLSLTSRGPAGPQGDPGPSWTGYTYSQNTPAATWTVTHTLGRIPVTATVLINGEIVDTDIDFPDNYTVVVTFATPQTGTLKLG